MQRVRVRDTAETENPGRPMPDKEVMGMAGFVESGRTVYGTGTSDEKYLLTAYFVRVDGYGPVLVGEDWLEEASE